MSVIDVKKKKQNKTNLIEIWMFGYRFIEIAHKVTFQQQYQLTNFNIHKKNRNFFRQ